MNPEPYKRYLIYTPHGPELSHTDETGQWVAANGSIRNYYYTPEYVKSFAEIPDGSQVK